MTDKVLWEDTAEKQTWFIRDGDKLIIETIWKDVSPILDANKAAQADFSATSKLGELVRVAEIPPGLYWDWQRQGILDDDAAFNRRMNDSNYQHLRTNSLKL